LIYSRESLNDADLDHQRLLWLDRTANVRIHGTTHERPQVRFERDERLLLQPLAARPYYSLVLDNEHEAKRLRSRPRQLVDVEKRPLAAYLAGGAV
jgi:hypothetical protein